MNIRPDLSSKRQKIYTAISEAAIDEFARHGLNGTSTKDIAAAAGISKAQLHYYIRSKEELYREVLLHVAKKWKDIFPFEDVDKGPEYVLGEYLRRKINYALNNPRDSRLFANEIMSGAHVFKELWGDSYLSFMRLVKVIKNWADEGKIKPVDPELFIINTWALTQHYADYEVQVRLMLDTEKPHALDYERIYNAIAAMVIEPVLLDK